mmetsp:Transcript_31677/g.54022  ORF Transcript_31677/g.54022 Transcript_31677/m.54022 type:complete len:342 (+) Transcript_31677:168-1193(+)
MINIMDICHNQAFDQLDDDNMETNISYSYEDFVEPIKVPLNEELADARCISIDSDTTASHNSSNHILADQYSDIIEDYDIYPTIIGKGHSGCVRECLHRSTSEKYAVKTIEKAKVPRRDHIQREIQILRSVDHHGIMKMVDCYEDEDYIHIVTERYTGGELFDKIVDNTTDHGCLSEGQAGRIIKSLLEAVQHLHSKDIVHRDIKPENVLFESSEEGSSIKLIDFGFSRTHQQNEGSMTNQVGSPFYMSPSVLQGKYDRTCDLWSIGVVAYILLCGYPPFNGQSDQEVCESILQGNLVFEKKVWGNLSNESRDFVSMLLCRDMSRMSTATSALQHAWIANV